MVEWINNIKEQLDMAKTLAKKLTGSKVYKAEFGDRELTESSQQSLENFDKIVGFNYDRCMTIVRFIKQGYTDWGEKWTKMKTLSSSDLEMQQILHGDIEGYKKYLDINSRKTAHFDHSPEIQSARGLKAAEKSRGSKEHSIRSVGYWIKQGLTDEAAKEKVRDIQATNSLKKYIKKYGEELGLLKFEERKQNWKETMSSPTIAKKRSLGLWRYIERYGEIEGKKKYLAMRKKRNENSRMGRASMESINALKEIMQLLDKNNTGYYFGVKGNKEWCIFDQASKRPYFYDLTVPSMSLILEYHGEAFHANPKWDSSKQESWRAAFSKRTAKESIEFDQYKKKVAESAGWTVYEIYSSEVIDSRRMIIEKINTLL